MAVESLGYAGTIAPGDAWADMQFALGREYFVFDAAAVKVTPYTSGARQVQIAAGLFGGKGIRDRNTSPALVQLPEVSSGTQYFMIVARRTWAGGATTFTYVPAGTDSVNLPARNVTPGTIDDQPLALVSLGAGASAVPAITADLRAWGQNLLIANDARVLQYLNGQGLRIRVGTVEWIRVSDVNGVGTWTQDPGPPGIISQSGANVYVSAPGWSGGGLYISARRFGQGVTLSFQVKRTGAAIAAHATSGNLANTTVATLQPAWRPSDRLVVSFLYASDSSVGGGIIEPSGSVQVVSGLPSTPINQNDVVYFSASFIQA